jgi:outer membrane murein-binding lipoprotein Lpp
MKKEIILLLMSVGTCVLLVGGCTEPPQKNKSASAVPVVASQVSQPPAAPKAAAGPEKILLTASAGNITFPHHKHQQAGIACNACHANGIGKIANLDMQWGHDTCKGCHTSKGAGPRDCKGCHKK